MLAMTVDAAVPLLVYLLLCFGASTVTFWLLGASCRSIVIAILLIIVLEYWTSRLSGTFRVFWSDAFEEPARDLLDGDLMQVDYLPGAIVILALPALIVAMVYWVVRQYQRKTSFTLGRLLLYVSCVAITLGVLECLVKLLK